MGVEQKHKARDARETPQPYLAPMSDLPKQDRPSLGDMISWTGGLLLASAVVPEMLSPQVPTIHVFVLALASCTLVSYIGTRIAIELPSVFGPHVGYVLAAGFVFTSVMATMLVLVSLCWSIRELFYQ
jgi:hypothetical protein